MNEHIIKLEAGFDCIRFVCRFGSSKCVPKGGGSHGRHGFSIKFVSKGEKGAVQFLLHTGWLPQKADESKIGYRSVEDWGSMVLPADLGYHSKAPIYDGQEPIDKACEFCDEQPCYYDGSGLNANDAMYALVNGGGTGLWTFLDDYYASVFDGGKYPIPAEYPAPLRG